MDSQSKTLVVVRFTSLRVDFQICLCLIKVRIFTLGRNCFEAPTPLPWKGSLKVEISIGGRHLLEMGRGQSSVKIVLIYKAHSTSMLECFKNWLQWFYKSVLILTYSC